MQRSTARSSRLSVVFAALLVTASFGFPASVGGATEEHASSPTLAAFTRWTNAHGPAWRVRRDETGRVRMLYGGMAASSLAGSHSRSDADFARVARSFVAEARGVLGVDEATLAHARVMLIPLAALGGTDKLSVRFGQEVGGVPVERGTVSVLLTPAGELLAIDSLAIPGLAGFETTPTRTASAARGLAARRFELETGTRPTEVGGATLNVVREPATGYPALAWRIRVMNRTEGHVPEGSIYRIAARGQARVVGQEAAVHHLDVGGTVMANASPGTRPDTPTNPAQAEVLPHVEVHSSGAGTTTTDANGVFLFPGVTGPLSVTVELEGPFNDVENMAGANHSYTQVLSGVGNSILMNPSPSEVNTAQTNAFARIAQLRELTRAVNPADGMMDFVNTTRVNFSSQCGAFWDGSSTRYDLSSAMCVNTAYATVIWHEQGHWQNERYGSGNGADGFGEGNADVFAMYTGDTPLIGEDFFGTGPGAGLRDGRNLRQYCGDDNPGCYSNVYDNGEVLMGVLWKVRENLQATHGQQLGGDVANGLFFGWMNAYDQGTIHSIIETQWLTLDDDDGNLANGTPNDQDIVDAFLTQGFPPVTAAAASRNGAGVNPDVFATVTLPVLGTGWTSTVDAGAVGGSGFSAILGYDDPLIPGIVIGLGEILVNVASGSLFVDVSAVVGGTATHGVAVPNDSSLVGYYLSVQAYLTDAGGAPGLTNALDLRLGLF